MRPDPPPPPVSKPPPREDAGALFFDGARALLDDVYRARLVKRRLRWPALHEACAVHVVEKRPNAVEEQRARILARRRFRDGRGCGSGRIVSDRGGT